MLSIRLLENHFGCFLSPSTISSYLCNLSQKTLHFFVLVLTALTNSLMQLTWVRMVSAVPSTDSESIFLPEPRNSFIGNNNIVSSTLRYDTNHVASRLPQSPQTTVLASLASSKRIQPIIVHPIHHFLCP